MFQLSTTSTFQLTGLGLAEVSSPKSQLGLLISEEFPIKSKGELQRRLKVLSEKSIDESLTILNQTYSDILGRNLKNKGKQASDSAREALKWVACSGRHLEEILLTAV
jgi:hypothetical protein